MILTPHPGEFARLNGCSVPEVLEAPVAMAESFARDHGAIVLLKGSSTLVSDGETTWLTDRGCPGMATAGSGDVLSGIAERFNVTVAELQQWNGIPNPDFIRAGQTLTIYPRVIR